jgi:hypothetical protein
MTAKKKIRIQDQDGPDGGSVDLGTSEVYLADGTRLTEARAQDLAEEVLHRTGRGRPSLTSPATTGVSPRC